MTPILSKIKGLRLVSLVFLSLLSLPLLSFGEDYEMEPAPADRTKYQYRREPGQFKRNKQGLVDPSPDVLSLKYLPKDNYGFVDWMKALNEGVINPRGSLKASKTPDNTPDNTIEFDRDILIRSKMDFMPDVIFPHSAHNAWLKCSVCHPRIFKMQAGGNDISMVGIWKGKFCGRCHDRVAFPTRNCFKCHSVKREGKKERRGGR